jgi:hypothetical protein
VKFLCLSGLFPHIVQFGPKIRTLLFLHKKKRVRFQLCETEPLKTKLMFASHDLPLSAHRSADKMYTAMWLNYFWRKMFKDIQNWVDLCIRCSKPKQPPKYRRAKLQPIMKHKPLGQVNIDLIGPMCWL